MGRRVTGVSQWGHTCQRGSSGDLHETQASLSRVVQTGHTRKLGSTAARQTGHSVRPAASRSSIALISSSRSRTSSRYSGGRKSMYTSAPRNGGTRPISVASATSHGLAIRRRASLNTQNPTASQKTTPTAIRPPRVNDQVRVAKKSESRGCARKGDGTTTAVCLLRTPP